MNKYIDALLEILERRTARITQTITQREAELERLKKSRKESIGRYVRGIVPNLNHETVRQLRVLLPSLHIPTVTFWIFFSKVDPDLTLDQLRIQVENYLNTNRDIPDGWKEIKDAIDTQITDNQNWTSTLRSDLAGAHEQIAGLNALKTADMSTMNPARRQILEEAIKTQIKHPETIARSTRKHVGSLSPTTFTSTHSDPDLATMFLWYHIFFAQPGGENHPHSESHFPQEGPGETQASESSREIINDLRHHEALGSQSYS